MSAVVFLLKKKQKRERNVNKKVGSVFSLYLRAQRDIFEKIIINLAHTREILLELNAHTGVNTR